MAPIVGGHRKAAITFILFVAILDVIAMAIVVPVLPVLVQEFTGSTARAGWMNGLFIALWAVMQFLFSPLVGSLSDRFGRRPVLLLSSAGLGISYALVALAPSLGWLAAARVLAGITASSIGATYAYMADITPPERRARAYGLIGAAFSGGFVLGPFLGGVVGEISPRLPFWAAAASSATVFLYGAFILPESLDPSRRMAFSWKRANPLGALRLLRSHRELFGLSVVNFLLYFAHHVFSSVFVLSILPQALWGLAMPTLLSLMTQRVSESEQGQLQGANSSVGSIAGIVSPVFFGGVYAASVGEGAWIPIEGAAFLIAASVLGLAGWIGYVVARRERTAEGVAEPGSTI